MDYLFIDFETYSSIDIKKAGAYRYAESDDFAILLCGYMFNSETEVTILDLTTNNGRIAFMQLFKKVASDENITIVAHNAAFERICLREYGFNISPLRFMCTANLSLYCGLPAALDGVSKALDLKDKKLGTGKDLIKYFSVPCKPTKTNGGRTRNMPEHAPEKWLDFIEYLRYDVLSEKEIFDKLYPLGFPDYERYVYAADQKINDYGILVDTDLMRSAILMDEAFKTELSNEVRRNQGINNLKSMPELKKYILDKTGLTVESLNKKSMDDVIAAIENSDSVSEEDKKDVLTVLDARKEIGKTSNAKYTAMQNSLGRGDRIRGLFRYYGASRTGRWAGRLVQLQNLPQNHIEDLDTARDTVKTKDLNWLKMMYEKPTHIMSQLIRTTFIAPEGMTFAVADFSAIEARVIAWVAQERWRLDTFADPTKDIYCESASMMFHVPVTKADSELRQKGKVSELALGYGGGVNALMVMDTKKAIDPDDMQNIVNLWRASSPRIVQLWRNIENAAKQAINKLQPSSVVIDSNARINFMYSPKTRYLTIQLPSGRKLFYPNAETLVRTVKTASGDSFDVENIGYMGQDQTTGKWVKLTTYGGKLTENVIQAIARDLLANAIFQVYKLGYNIVLHVHDEIAAEIPEDGNSEEVLKTMSDAMCMPPKWAVNIPLRAAGYITKYYKKD